MMSLIFGVPTMRRSHLRAGNSGSSNVNPVVWVTISKGSGWPLVKGSWRFQTHTGELGLVVKQEGGCSWQLKQNKWQVSDTRIPQNTMKLTQTLIGLVKIPNPCTWKGQNVLIIVHRMTTYIFFHFFFAIRRRSFATQTFILLNLTLFVFLHSVFPTAKSQFSSLLSRRPPFFPRIISVFFFGWF